MIDEKRHLYKCDPDLNRKCTKTGCIYNPNAIHWTCDATTNIDYALRDSNGEPIELTEEMLRKREPVFRDSPEYLRAPFENNVPYKELRRQ